MTDDPSDDGTQRQRKLSPPIWSDSSSFLDSIDHLIAAINDKSNSSFLDSANDLLEKSMIRLESEFRNLLRSGAAFFDSFGAWPAHYPDSSNVEDGESRFPAAYNTVYYDGVIDALPPETVRDLHEIAKRMVAAGYVQECSRAYSACRQEILNESFSRLGFCNFGANEVQKMPWIQLENKIGKWIKTANATLRILFPSERRLCDRIFSGFSSVADLSFTELCRGSMIQLLSFADAVAIESRSPERLFKVLDVYETVRDLMPEIESVFSNPYCLSLRNEALTILQRLGEVIRGLFMELENLIARDPVKSLVPGGGLHPINRYVMNYLIAACRSRQTLEQVFKPSSVCRNVDYGKSLSSSSLGVEMGWIIELLETNLEAKSKAYKNPGLCSVFMMNNLWYIVHKAKDNELGKLLGDDWIDKYTSKVRQYHLNYERCCWKKVFGVLKVDDNLATCSSLREKLKLFHLYFDDICKIQSSWVVSSEQLREELRISVLGTVSIAYRDFGARLLEVDDSFYTGYCIEDVEAGIEELFQGIGSGRK